MCAGQPSEKTTERDSWSMYTSMLDLIETDKKDFILIFIPITLLTEISEVRRTLLQFPYQQRQRCSCLGQQSDVSCHQPGPVSCLAMLCMKCVRRCQSEVSLLSSFNSMIIQSASSYLLYNVAHVRQRTVKVRQKYIQDVMDVISKTY